MKKKDKKSVVGSSDMNVAVTEVGDITTSVPKKSFKEQAGGAFNKFFKQPAGQSRFWSPLYACETEGEPASRGCKTKKVTTAVQYALILLEIVLIIIVLSYDYENFSNSFEPNPYAEFIVYCFVLIFNLLLFIIGLSIINTFVKEKHILPVSVGYAVAAIILTISWRFII